MKKLAFFVLVVGLVFWGCDIDAIIGGNDVTSGASSSSDNGTTGGNNSGNNNGNNSGTTGSNDNGTTGNNNNNGENDIDEDLPLPLSSGVNVVSGKTYFFGYSKIVFSATADGATSGTYSGSSIESGSYPTASDKYSYVDIETGAYSWNEEAKTVTLKPENVAILQSASGDDNADYHEFSNINESSRIDQNYGAIGDKTAIRSALQAMLNSYKEEIGEEAFNQELLSLGFSSMADYVNSYVNSYVNGLFSNRTYGYSFSTDGTALFLEPTLPANKGVNELAGQTYYGLRSNGGGNKDENQTYVFTTSGYTYTGYSRTETGSYAYDSNSKTVWLKKESENGRDRITYYAAITADGETRYADINAYRAAKTNSKFGMGSSNSTYNSTDKTIGN